MNVLKRGHWVRIFVRSHAKANSLMQTRIEFFFFQNVLMTDLSTPGRLRKENFCILRWFHSQKSGKSRKSGISIDNNIIDFVSLKKVVYHFRVGP